MNNRVRWAASNLVAVPLNTGAEMKFFVVILAMCALSQSAFAQTGECKSIPDARGRQACYDKAGSPPAAAAKPSLRAAPELKVDTAKDVDSIDEEDARMHARLKNICRGC
jgi:hypothetical protein